MLEPSVVPYALIVEDDPLIRMDACDIIATAGFRCIDAKDGEEAKELIDLHGPSITLLFTDVEMPGATNGFALARYASKKFPEMAIVVASGRVKPGPDDMPDGAHFIGKPFSADLVHSHLREMLPDGKQPEPLKKPM